MDFNLPILQQCRERLQKGEEFPGDATPPPKCALGICDGRGVAIEKCIDKDGIEYARSYNCPCLQKHKINGKLQNLIRQIGDRALIPLLQPSKVNPQHTAYINAEIAIKHWRERQSDDNHSTFLFTGPTGTGKTLSSLMMLKGMIKQFERIRYIARFEHLCDVMIQSEIERWPSEWKEIQECQILIVDEFQPRIYKNESTNDRVRMLARDIIELGYQFRTTLILCSNLNHKQISEWLDAPTYRRLVESLEDGMTIEFVKSKVPVLREAKHAANRS